jgi:hypothetical protein
MTSTRLNCRASSNCASSSMSFIISSRNRTSGSSGLCSYPGS